MKMRFFRKTLSFFIVPVMIPILILGTLLGLTLTGICDAVLMNGIRIIWTVREHEWTR